MPDRNVRTKTRACRASISVVLVIGLNEQRKEILCKVVLATRLRDTTDKEQPSLGWNMRILGQGSGVLTHDFRMLFGVGTAAGLTDAQLLRQFAANRDPGAQAAFAALVARHGPMVLRVCGTTLRDVTDIEDAFQATFLVLARKARSIRKPDSVGSWIFGVALRISSNARLAAIRRRRHERQWTAAATTRRTEEDRDDFASAVWEEVDRLAEKYRAPVVLCYLEGLTHEAAARHLGWPVGTVEGRLARARGLLRSRLTRRGLAPAIGLPGASTSARAIPGVTADSMARLAMYFIDGRIVAPDLVPIRAAAFAKQVVGDHVSPCDQDSRDSRNDGHPDGALRGGAPHCG